MSDDSRLRDLQAQMHAVLRGQQPPAALATTWQVPPERVAIYAQFVAAHVRTVLDKDFSCLAAVLGASWEDVASAYVRDVPATHYELNEAGRAFPAFLRAHAERLGLHGGHLELAELEWLDWEVYASQAPDLRSQELSPAQARDATLAANPTLAVVEIRHGAHLALAQRAAGHAPTIAGEPGAPVTVAVYRHPQSRGSAVRPLDDADLFVLALAARRLTLAQAAAETGLANEPLLEIVTAAVARGIVSLVAPA
ncbi:MAG: putative DNA-binding domain-containing protein [Myxococcales bacterium]|nr:putative DNA-binding domain-containing protein [Myxococcales bacterium]